MSSEPQNAEQREAGTPAEPELDPQELRKLAIELGPLVVFLLAWVIAGIKWATGLIMVASVVAMLASWRTLGRVTAPLATSSILAVAFGGLTLLLNDTRWVMLKPTAVYLLFAAALAGGVVLGRPVLKLLLGDRIDLTDQGWRIMSLRWAGCFAFLAILNELVRMFLSEGTWVLCKVLLFPALLIAFGLAQSGLMERHQKTSSLKR